MRFDLEREAADAMQPSTLNVEFVFQSSGAQLGWAAGTLVWGLAWQRDLLVELGGRGWTGLGLPPASLGTDGVFSGFGCSGGFVREY